MSRAWKAPNRPNHQITQAFNSGVVIIYSVENKAQPGYQPAPELTEKVRLRYEEQRLGINRLYLSRQNQAEVEKVIRTPRRDEVSNQDIAVLQDGQMFAVDYTQTVDDAFPPSMDISLVKTEQVYEVPR